MEKTKGILLCAWGKVGYGYAAFNFAASIKYHSKDIPVYLITDGAAIAHLNDQYRDVFDSIEVLGTPVSDPGLFKVSIYDKLPFDYTLFMDVDALCINDVHPLLNQLVADYESDGRYYRTHIHGWYDNTSPDDMPLMYWAKRSIIWERYGFSDHQFPATQSSIQFIAKCEQAEQFYKELVDTMTNNPIPLDELTHQWGGTQPDELYLNIQIAKSGIKPDLNEAMWFCDNAQLRPHQLVQQGFTFLSYFGVRARIKSYFIDFYDKTLIKLLRSMGFANHYYKAQNIFKDKHANFRAKVTVPKAPRPTVFNRTPSNAPTILSPNIRSNGWGKEAFIDGQVFAPKPVPTEPIKGTVHLYMATDYKDIPPVRRTEIWYCLNQNCFNPNITKIFNFGSVTYEHEKVTTIPVTERPTYQTFIDHANQNPADYTIFINSDIYTDNTLNWVDKIDMENTMLALCRYEIPKGEPKLEAYSWSQGTWIFKGKINLTGMNYTIGLPGCENAFAFDAHKQGYKVINPSVDIRTYHMHSSNIRTYTQADRIHGNGYLEVKISPIEPVEQKKRICIIQPGAVGDIIIVLPIAEYYAKQGYAVEWVCPESFHSMFDYVDYVKPITTKGSGYERVIDLSFGIDTKSEVHKVWKRKKATLDSFVTLKYELAQVPLDVLRQLNYKRDEAKENRLYDIVTSNFGDVYSLVHGSSNYGGSAQIHTEYNQIQFKPIQGYSIFDWRKVIENAKEIHCIDSSLCNFVDAIPTDAKLFYYKTPKVPAKADETILTKSWEYINQLDYVA